jgi:hypothetical protein
MIGAGSRRQLPRTHAAYFVGVARRAHANSKRAPNQTLPAVVVIPHSERLWGGGHANNDVLPPLILLGIPPPADRRRAPAIVHIDQKEQEQGSNE